MSPTSKLLPRQKQRLFEQYQIRTVTSSNASTAQDAGFLDKLKNLSPGVISTRHPKVRLKPLKKAVCYDFLAETGTS